MFVNGITVFIAISNIIVRAINIRLIRRVGYNTESQLMINIMGSILYASFINTSILILLCNANLETFKYLSWIPLRGQFHDTSTNWYVQIAPAIVQTVIVLAVFPQINFAIFCGIRLLQRFLDSGFRCCSKTPPTRKTTQRQYVDLYAGPEMLMYFKYSNVMNLVFAAFTHGAALPILFPVTWFGILNNYFTERILLAYYYRTPPMFDNKLDRAALRLLRFAPIFGLLMSYWYLGNRQIFFNESGLLAEAFGEMLGIRHPVFPVFDKPDHTLILLLALLCIALDLLLSFAGRGAGLWAIVRRLLPCCGCARGAAKIERAIKFKTNEDLGNFFECLSGIQQMRWFAQEHYNRKFLGIKQLDDGALEKLRTSKQKKKMILNLCDFDIMKNERYTDSFLYTTLDRRFEADDSDIVARILLLNETMVKREDPQLQRLSTAEEEAIEALALEKIQFTKGIAPQVANRRRAVYMRKATLGEATGHIQRFTLRRHATNAHVKTPAS